MDDQNREYEDYEALRDELFALLDQHRMKALSQKLGEMNEFDISEFLGELWEDNPQRMAMVFRILSKEIAAAVFATSRSRSRRRSSTPSPIRSLPASSKSCMLTTPST